METTSQAGPWAALCLGWLLGARVLPGRTPLEPSLPPFEALAPDLVGAAPRALRRVPGVGERRALELARARWAHDPSTGPFDPEVARGVGPATARALSVWLAEMALGGPRAGADRTLLGRPP